MAANSEHRNHNQQKTAIRLLSLGIPLIIAGLVFIAIASGSLNDGIGAAITAFGILPTIAGLVLFGAARVETRSREDKPFA
jgi:Ca2+/H+ antiporter